MLITTSPTEIHVNGHANYAPFGQDIVCSAVSVLMQILGREIEAYGNVHLSLTQGNGFILFRGERMGKEQHVLWNALVKGLFTISQAYPQYVKYEKKNANQKNNA